MRAVSDPDNGEAEFAIVVRSDLHGRGLRRLLMNKIEHYTRAQGLQRLVGRVLRENAGMRDLARHRGFTVDTSKPPEPGVVSLVRVLESRPPI